MNKTVSLFIAGFLVGTLATTVGFSALLKYKPVSDQNATAATVLKLGHTLNTNHPVHLGIERMRQRLQQLSGGTMTIDIYPGSVLGTEVQCIEQLQNGSLTMTKTSAVALESFIPEMAVFGLPYIFRDQTHCWNVLEGDIGKRLLKKGEIKRLRGLCYYDAGSRNFYSKSNPLRSPDDLSKLKIRVMNSASAMDMVEAFGASPTPIAWGELYSALAQGTVDGAENNLPSFTTNKHYEVCKHFALDGHSRIPDLLMIGTVAWDRLSEQQQQWLTDAATQSAVYQRSLWAEETNKARELAESEGVTFYDVDTSQFARQVQPMLDAIDNEVLRQLLQDIREIN